MIRVHEFDPLHDARWPAFVGQHKLATVFHSSAWLEALRRTYGYGVAALTTCAPGEALRNALVFCRVESWLTGRRLVSIPFADHCTPLATDAAELECLLAGLKRESEGKRKRYVEIRNVDGSLEGLAGYSESIRYCLHRLDLHPSLDELFRGLHGSCIRRRLTRAMREGFVYEEGRSEALLQKFYRLSVMTRRRQNMPPQPLAWFRNLIACFGAKLKIRLLCHSGEPAAAILTIQFGNTMTYKYGGSDNRFHRLGSMQFLMWKAIEDAKNQGLSEFDMGRSDWTNEGLVAFKDRWGCKRFEVVHVRYPVQASELNAALLKKKIAKQLFALAPDSLLMTAGNLLYRHMA